MQDFLKYVCQGSVLISPQAVSPPCLQRFPGILWIPCLSRTTATYLSPFFCVCTSCHHPPHSLPPHPSTTRRNCQYIIHHSCLSTSGILTCFRSVYLPISNKLFINLIILVVSLCSVTMWSWPHHCCGIVAVNLHNILE